MKYDEHLPGAQAPVTGRYEELNVLGSRTGLAVYAKEGDRLPVLPRGFMWRLNRTVGSEAIPE